MIIRNITIENYGGIDRQDFWFERDINCVRREDAEVVFGAIGRVLRSPVITVNSDGGPPITDETQIWSDIVIGKDLYSVIIRGRLMSGKIRYEVYGPDFHEIDSDDETESKTLTGARFYERIYRSLEEASLSTYRYNSRKPYAKRLAEYLERGDPEQILKTAKDTDNIASTAVFRRCLKKFIDGYQPEWIDQEQNLRAYLGKDGVFKNRREGATGRYSLSTSEKVLSDFRCFLKLNEFWKSVEQIRDMNHVDWPLFVLDFAQYIDQSVDLTYYLRQAEELGRQVFFTEP